MSVCHGDLSLSIIEFLQQRSTLLLHDVGYGYTHPS